MYQLSINPYAEKERVNLAKIPSRNGGELLWSNKLFKMWKKEFHRNYREKYGKGFRESFPNSQQRAMIYENIFGIKGSHIIGEYSNYDSVCDSSIKKIDGILTNMSDWQT